MFNWFKSLVDGGRMDAAKRVSAEWELSREIAPLLAEVLQIPILTAGKTPETLYGEQPAFFCGYLVGFADVMSQNAGGDPGGNLSQNLALRLCIELFGQKNAENMWPELMNYMNSDSPEFEFGTNLGGQDGNRISNKGLPRNLGQHLGLNDTDTKVPPI